MPYATVAEFRTSSKLTAAGLDSQIQLCLEAASAAIDGFCNRPDGFVATVPTARAFASAGRDYVACDECVAVSLVEEYDGTWRAVGTGDWIAFSGDIDAPLYQPPYSAVMRVGGPFPAGPLARVRITAQWGASESVPPMVKTACLAQATKWFKRFEGAFSTALATNNLGRKAFVQALDPDVEFMLVSARLIRPSL